jgi:hypothetical protein
MNMKEQTVAEMQRRVALLPDELAEWKTLTVENGTRTEPLHPYCLLTRVKVITGLYGKHSWRGDDGLTMRQHTTAAYDYYGNQTSWTDQAESASDIVGLADIV